MSAYLKSIIREVPDFPKPGIPFKDITPLLADPVAFNTLLQGLVWAAPAAVTKVVGLEARGLIIGAPLADRVGAGFIPARKKGKLPYKTRAQSYDLEYGQDTIEIHDDALNKSDVVLIVDDLLATGGTAEAAIKLVRSFGCSIAGAVFAIELGYLGGRKRLEAMGMRVTAVIQYE